MSKKTMTTILSLVFSLAFAGTALAQEGEGLPAEVKKYVAFAAGIGLAIAAFGGALGQAKAAAAALEGITRNPASAKQVFTPFILALALIESLVIYSLVVSVLLYTKL
ncbi:MAG: ATP synthase F0 subunit C [Deltaproteobacteria bacterium]|nr:ATP synthase F0 subunit C [bacterium]MCB9477477.1 ATP synthase F0 subunit C [Deltaproteobacteria bacterium]MCB9479294.1 ATP synthase F0 subunit C [Deltaproteobacteria bacterium]MCB9488738.1 ATP synthase F0 subunit C [Deltaproteobacteria bacterium]